MRTHAGRRRTRLFALVTLPLLALIGCHHDGNSAATGNEQSVPLFVLQGPSGSTLALVPVYLNGQGPFAFALDTGASQSVVDEDLADQLKLPKDGPAVEMTGVSATAEATQVRVNAWRVGDVELPGRSMVCLKLSAANRRVKMRGLLGSDVLSRFGAVTVDYNNQRLLLRVHP